MENRPEDVQSLRLVAAFFEISDPDVRREILAVVEAVAGGAAISPESLRSLANAARLS